MKSSEYMTTQEARELLRVSAQTLRNWRAEGKIHAVNTPGGRPRYLRSELEAIIGPKPAFQPKRITIGYCRVSTSGQKDDLERQKEVVQAYCEHAGYMFRIESDVGSGLNFRRKAFSRMIDEVMSGSVERIVVNYQDRLCRFGYELVRQICDANMTEIEIINQTSDISDEEELAQDALSVITVFSARLYGRRSHRNRDNIRKAHEMFDSGEGKTDTDSQSSPEKR